MLRIGISPRAEGLTVGLFEASTTPPTIALGVRPSNLAKTLLKART
jgi:hypothetical protein